MSDVTPEAHPTGFIPSDQEVQHPTGAVTEEEPVGNPEGSSAEEVYELPEQIEPDEVENGGE